jgi:hypothetical protein
MGLEYMLIAERLMHALIHFPFALIDHSLRFRPNMDITNLSPAQLRKAADLKERIDSLTSELASILGGKSSLNPQPLPPKSSGRQMSAAGRARIAAAARARWARARAAKGGIATSKSPAKSRRRTLSPAARAKIAAAAKARWAKAKAAGKSHL